MAPCAVASMGLFVTGSEGPFRIELDYMMAVKH
jgi:hypothetical protein